jgi:hypothetical protein
VILLLGFLFCRYDARAMAETTPKETAGTEEASPFFRAMQSARVLARRAMDGARNEEERHEALQRILRSEKAWRAEAKYQVCVLELQGLRVGEIANELGLSACAVSNLLSIVKRRRNRQIARTIDLHRSLELERSERILEKFMTLALDEELFECLARGEELDPRRVARAVRSALLVLAVLDFRCRLLGLYPASARGPRGKEDKDAGGSWLKTQALIRGAYAQRGDSCEPTLSPPPGEDGWDAL